MAKQIFWLRPKDEFSEDKEDIAQNMLCLQVHKGTEMQISDEKTVVLY